MNLKKPIEYEKRPVGEWLTALLDGSLALPLFQRSYVWTRPKIEDLILALLAGRPVGTMLLIDRYDQHSQQRFSPRAPADTGVDPNRAVELILDGQQRLTSIWRAVELGPAAASNGASEGAFLKVRDIHSRQLEPESVVWPSSKQAGQLLDDPRQALEKHWIPLRIFHPHGADSSDEPARDRVRRWCTRAVPGDSELCFDLRDRISRQLRQRLLERNIWFARLPGWMSRSEAIEVFVKVNESSAVIRKFDIAVAELDRDGERSLRQTISDWSERTPSSEAFFGRDEQKMIPEVGELILKIACLQEGLNPTDGQFTKEPVLGRIGAGDGLDDIKEGITWTFGFLADEKIWTRNRLPSWVPLRVIPALYPTFRPLLDASDCEGTVRRELCAKVGDGGGGGVSWE